MAFEVTNPPQYQSVNLLTCPHTQLWFKPQKAQQVNKVTMMAMVVVVAGDVTGATDSIAAIQGKSNLSSLYWFRNQYTTPSTPPPPPPFCLDTCNFTNESSSLCDCTKN